jgi:hypothetical protein
MASSYPVFVYLDNDEKVQIGVATLSPVYASSDFSVDFTVPMYIEEGEDKILVALDPKDLPEMQITI